eukprot:984350-Rhodomonas_salina.1
MQSVKSDIVLRAGCAMPGTEAAVRGATGEAAAGGDSGSSGERRRVVRGGEEERRGGRVEEGRGGEEDRRRRGQEDRRTGGEKEGGGGGVCVLALRSTALAYGATECAVKGHSVTTPLHYCAKQGYAELVLAAYALPTYQPTPDLRDARVYGDHGLRVGCAVSGTDIGPTLCSYALPTPCPVLAQRMVLSSVLRVC